MTKSVESTAQRRKLLGEIERLAEIAVFGTLSETYRTCGRAGCHCQSDNPSMVLTDVSSAGRKARPPATMFPKQPRFPHEKASPLGNKMSTFCFRRRNQTVFYL